MKNNISLIFESVVRHDSRNDAIFTSNSPFSTAIIDQEFVLSEIVIAEVKDILKENNISKPIGKLCYLTGYYIQLNRLEESIVGNSEIKIQIFDNDKSVDVIIYSSSVLTE